jgi:hypothetical protein
VTKKITVSLLLCLTAALSQEIGARYLIITHDNFYNDIQPLAEWKHKKGMRTKVVKTSDIGSSASQIKNYIAEACTTWSIPPDYVLFVGAPNLIPFGYGFAATYTDAYYTDIDGDTTNEVLSGRLTVHNTTEAQTVVNKILVYERTPDLTDSTWFIDACLIVNEDYYYYPPQPGTDDSIYWSDARHAYTLMLANGYNEIDTLSDLLGHNSNDVIQSVNNGCAFVMYRGQGVGNWWSPFDVYPQSTANGNRLPIVLSITCRTIGTSGTPATAEQWLLTGTPTQPRGGAAYFATTVTGSNIAQYRSAVAKGFFTSVFSTNRPTFGRACEHGRVDVKRLYPGYYGLREYEGFTTLGDPEMNIWTAIPKPIQVQYDSAIPVNAESMDVTVTMEGVPVASAIVCIMQDTTVYQHGYTNMNGTITFYFDSLSEGQMDITVTGGNIIPHEGIIQLTGVKENAVIVENPSTSFTLSPNPFRQQLLIKLPALINIVSDKDKEYTLDIYDASGKLVKSYNMKNHSSDNIVWSGHDEDGRDLPNGVYFLFLNVNSEKSTRKAVLLR